MEITKESLEKLYIQDKKSCKEISLIFKISIAQVSRLLKKFAIPTRPFSTKGTVGWAKGVPKSDETRQRLSKAHTGKKLSPEHRAKVVRTLNHGVGSDNHSWRGGRILTEEGYVLVRMPDHPFARLNGYVAEHRIVMEAYLGRFLKEDEIIHHRNEIKSDNRVINLLLTTQQEHGYIHWDDEQKRKERATFMSNLRKQRFWSSKKKDY